MPVTILMTRKLVALALGGLGLLGAGCGQTSHFSVDVIVSGPTGRRMEKMREVSGGDVKAEGAISDQSQFGLENLPRSDSYVYPLSNSQIILTRFQYGTTSDSGKVTFTVTLKDGSLNALATGSGEGTIQSGSNVPMSVTVDPVSTWQ
jgi:VCBS repeat-containing protein